MARRISERYEIEREIGGIVDGQPLSLFLYNLSLGGCMVEMRDSLMWQGDKLRLDLFDYAAVDGEVVWTFGSCAGIRFDTSLPPSMAERLGLSSSDSDFRQVSPRDRLGTLLHVQPAR